MTTSRESKTVHDALSVLAEHTGTYAAEIDRAVKAVDIDWLRINCVPHIRQILDDLRVLADIFLAGMETDTLTDQELRAANSVQDAAMAFITRVGRMVPQETRH